MRSSVGFYQPKAHAIARAFRLEYDQNDGLWNGTVLKAGLFGAPEARTLFFLSFKSLKGEKLKICTYNNTIDSMLSLYIQ